MSAPGLPAPPAGGPPPGGPGGGAPPGGPTPGASPGMPPAGGTGAATAPRPQLGAAIQSLNMLHQALKVMQLSLVGLPMGTELHDAVYKAVGDISKKMMQMGDKAGGGDQAGMMQSLMAQMKESQGNPQSQMVQKMLAQKAGQQQGPLMPGGPGGGPPAGA